MAWGSPEEIERRRRIRLAVWAYAYEKLDESLVSDEVFDAEAYLVDLSVITGNPKMDLWFKRHFKPFTGQWVNQHPGIKRLHEIATTIINERGGPSGSLDQHLCPDQSGR